ncbi:hypothetical protein KCV87_00855 [Actinosynnema pretiosum subsp. pretiosum]|uniref:Uncharacterized protein n=1 Tax=Actinosynnema pretiosum subsp. pretiosum TaxID=103721 RepID=A0AA45R4K8_9PSEU|nr:hypothetical protein APASM_3836 [Actinosynnema pretiosum subsp. pretiosum]QUF04728.1 hypothetical protein KCV87_00855 [Actinosynnema pretiosum subsp. pretiosum]
MSTKTMSTPARHTAPGPLRQRVQHPIPPDWPTTTDPETGQVCLLLGTVVDALVMRAGLAAEVNHNLACSLLQAPVVIVPATPGRSDDWIFLTGPRTALRQSTVADLLSAKVGWYEPGKALPLPGDIPAPGEPRWLSGRAKTALPPWGAVIGAVRRTCCSRAW